MVPGPVSIPEEILEAFSKDLGSGQIEPAFIPFYDETSKLIAKLMGTKHDVVLMGGEGMLALWGAMKSCLKAGDKLISIGTGVFGDGMADMAESIGCKVTKISLPYDSTIGNDDSLELIRKKLKEIQPKMMTAVHCETPSGTLNPLAELGKIKKDLGIPLFYVDAVASVGGVSLDADQHNIDLVLLGSQKCLSATSSISMVGVSDMAWEIMKEVDYKGYDAILPFKTVREDGRCPCTPDWHGIAAVHAGASLIMKEGMEAVFARHEKVAKECRQGLENLGIKLFPRKDAVLSPTVTACLIPEGISWVDWSLRLRQKGLIVAGSFGPMAGKVFRLGHMGSQADSSLVAKALKVLEESMP